MLNRPMVEFSCLVVFQMVIEEEAKMLCLLRFTFSMDQRFFWKETWMWNHTNLDVKPFSIIYPGTLCEPGFLIYPVKISQGCSGRRK